MTSTTGILRIAFRGDELWGVRDEEGKPYVVIRRVCEMLGMDFASQLTRLRKQGQLDKLRRTNWAEVKMLCTTSKNGKRYKMACLRQDQVQRWLETLRTKSETGSLYALKCDHTGLIKIGFSTDVPRRVSMLRSQCPTTLRLERVWGDKTVLDERFIHETLKRKRHHGEWFKVTLKELGHLVDTLLTPVEVPS